MQTSYSDPCHAHHGASVGVQIQKLFPEKNWPQGEIQDQPGDFNTFRTTDKEKRYLDRLNSDLYDTLREAAEVHRQVRRWSQSWIKPGIKLTDMCELLENKNRELVGERGLERGIAFPTGCSLNHVAAHYTPNTGDNTVLGYDDVMKVDFGTQINGGYIVVHSAMCRQ